MNQKFSILTKDTYSLISRNFVKKSAECFDNFTCKITGNVEPFVPKVPKSKCHFTSTKLITFQLIIEYYERCACVEFHSNLRNHFPSESNLCSKRICLSLLIVDPWTWLIYSNYPNWNSLTVLNVCHFLPSKSFRTKKTEQNLLFVIAKIVWKNHLVLVQCVLTSILPFCPNFY